MKRCCICVCRRCRWQSASPVVAGTQQTPASTYQTSRATSTGTRSRSDERFAFVLASDGSSFISPTFTAQYSGAKDAGLFRGAYHFARPDKSGPKMQADRFIDIVGYNKDGSSLPPVWTWKTIPTAPNATSCPARKWSHGFIGSFARSGSGPIGMG